MEWFRILPTVNASLNALSLVMISLGYIAIRRQRRETHRRLMLGACATSLLFLVSYLVYHYFAGSTKFTGEGPIRTFYFAILLSHTVLAAAIVPLVLASVYLGLRQRFETHRKVSRWTFPIWLYVSITGVLVYLFLYHFYA